MRAWAHAGIELGKRKRLANQLRRQNQLPRVRQWRRLHQCHRACLQISNDCERIKGNGSADLLRQLHQ